MSLEGPGLILTQESQRGKNWVSGQTWETDWSPCFRMCSPTPFSGGPNWPGTPSDSSTCKRCCWGHGSRRSSQERRQAWATNSSGNTIFTTSWFRNHAKQGKSFFVLVSLKKFLSKLLLVPISTNQLFFYQNLIFWKTRFCKLPPAARFQKFQNLKQWKNYLKS